MPIDQRQINELFDRARGLTGVQRNKFLDEHCRDTETRNAVLEKLENETHQSKGRSHAKHDKEPPKIPGYEIVEPLGHGGMGVVYKAKKLGTEEFVAIKVLHAFSSADEDLRRRFEQEAKTISALSHENVVKIVEIGSFEHEPFIALEFVDGPTLAEKVGEMWEPKSAARFIRKLATTLAAVHEKGIIHRDLKPANVLIDRKTGVAKIADFGLAKLQPSDQALTLNNLTKARSPHTMTGAILGTPSYMAPEQALGQNQKISKATDIYALGAILFELICGNQLFDSESLLEKFDKIRNIPPNFPGELAKNSATRNLVTICLKCLNKDPEHRYQLASELADDLQRFENGQPVLARRRRVEANRGALRYFVVATVLLVMIVASLLAWNIFIREKPVIIASKGFPGYMPLEIAKEMGILQGIEFKTIEKVDEGLDLLNKGEVDVALCLPESLMFARVRNKSFVAILKLDQSLGDCIVAKDQVGHFGDLVPEPGQNKKILIQTREPSNTLLLGISSALGIDPSSLDTWDEGAEQAINRFLADENVWAAGSYPPHTTGLRTLFTAASAKEQFPDHVIDVTDIMVVRKSFLESNPAAIEKILEAWFEVVRILADPNAPRHEEALMHAAKIMEVKYHYDDYDVAAFKADLAEIILAGEQANRQFFELDENDDSQFLRDLERARILYNAYETVNTDEFDPEGDASKFTLRYLDKRMKKSQ